MTLSPKSPSQRAFSHYLRTGRRLPPEMFSEGQDVELKFNPYHDPRNGQFTFGPGGSGPRGNGPRGTGTSLAGRSRHPGPHAPAEPKLYIVRKGNTLSHIARRHGVRTDALARANAIQHPDHIQAGQKLRIPHPPGEASHPVVTPSPQNPGKKTPDISAQPAAATGVSTGRKWKVKDAQVKVPDSIRGKIDQVAKDYHAATGQTLVVTDGARTPHDQAERIYYKFSHGDFSTYKSPQADQLAAVYRQGRASGKSRSQILNDMAAIIDHHFRNGHPISKHLLGMGVDFRTKDMTLAQKQALQRAIKKNGGSPLDEGVPRHIHASF